VIPNAKLMATNKPKLTIYLKNGYKSKLKQYVDLKQDRLPSVSSTAGEIIEDFLDSLIDQKILTPITEQDIQSEFSDKS
jgi:hypothetical protein